MHERRFAKAYPFHRQQLVKPGLRRISDADEYVGKPRERIDAIERGDADEAVHHHGALTAARIAVDLQNAGKAGEMPADRGQSVGMAI